ncbi:hypothetical protein D3C81_1415220 [compost metagenome]
MDVGAQQFLHLRHLQGSGHCRFLTFTDVGSKGRCNQRIADPQIIVQIGFVALADVQFPAQTGERGNGHFFQDVRQDIE